MRIRAGMRLWVGLFLSEPLDEPGRSGDGAGRSGDGTRGASQHPGSGSTGEPFSARPRMIARSVDPSLVQTVLLSLQRNRLHEDDVGDFILDVALVLRFPELIDGINQQIRDEAGRFCSEKSTAAEKSTDAKSTDAK
jgi:hypothetical protein